MDQSNAVLPGTTVSVIEERTRDTRETVTDGSGEYAFGSLFAGTYTVRTALTGFKTSQQTHVLLPAGGALRIDVRLIVGDRAETVLVTAPAEMIRTDSGSRQYTLTTREFSELPMVSRSALELLRILPGVVPPEPESLELITGGSGANATSSYTVNGIRGRNNTVTLDGTDLIDIGSNTGVSVSPNPEMLQEITVQTSNYAAEYGSSAMQVSAITRSGSSQFHGSAYDYARNWRWSANDRSNALLNIEKPHSRYQYPGVTLGGPVLLPGTQLNHSRERLFFFLGVEVQRQLPDNGSSLATVPTERQRRGDFSENLLGIGDNLGQQMEVLIPSGFPGAGTPAPGNDLSPYVHPLGRALVNQYPLPNYQDPDNLYNYASHLLQPSDREQLSVRVDYKLTDATRAYVRIARDTERIENPTGIWFGGVIPAPTPAIGSHPGTTAAANIVSVLNSSMTTELLVSYGRLSNHEDFKDPSLISRESLAAPDVGFFPNQTPFTPLNVWSGDITSRYTSDRVFADSDTWQMSSKTTKVAGAHLMKFGASVERASKWQNSTNGESGTISLSRWGPGSTGNEVADLLVGRPFAFSQGTRLPYGHFRFWNAEGFAQDSWKVRGNLTLELGLRWSYLPNNAEVKGLGAIFNPAEYDASQPAYPNGDVTRLNGVTYSSRNEIPLGVTRNRGLYWLPRAGFAWDIDRSGRWLVRGGAGRFVNRPWGNNEYGVLRISPNGYGAAIDAYSGAGLGDGLGLTYDTIREIDPYTQAQQSLDTSSAYSIQYPETVSMSVSVARRLPASQTLEIGYVGTRGRHLDNTRPANAVPLGALLSGELAGVDLSIPVNRVALDASVIDTLRPFQAYQNVTSLEYEGHSQYDSLQLTLSRQVGHGLSYLLAYTRAHSTDTSAMLNVVDPTRNQGVPDSDRRHRFTLSFNVPVPSVPVGSPGWLKAITNSWQVSGISTFASGTPIRLALGGEIGAMAQAWFGTPSIFEGGWFGFAPIYLGDPRTGHGRTVGSQLMTLDALAIPEFGQTGPTIPPYDLRTPWRWNHDLAVSRNIRLRGAQSLQFRASAFDLFNTAYPSYVNTSLDTVCRVLVDGVPTGAGYTVDRVCDPTGGFDFTDDTRRHFGRIELLSGHRIVELSLKYSW